MRRIAIPLFTLLAWTALTQSAQPQTTIAQPALASRSVEADLIRSWYRDYLGRDVGPELTAWVELLKGGMSPTDVQATILGSDEFYYQKGRDPQTFVLETLQAITWSQPTNAEIRRWTDRLTALRGDRFALVREILLSSGQPQTGGAQVVEIAHRLQSASRLLVDTIDFEIGDTTQGRQAHLKAAALSDAVEDLHRVVSRTNYRPDDALLSIDAARRASQALDSTLNNPPGTAPSASSIARRIGTMLTEASGSIRPPVVPVPGPGTGGSGGFDLAKLQEQITAASRGTQSLVQLLTSQSYNSYTYSVVLRDLDTFSANLVNFDNLARRGTDRQRLQWELDALRTQADRIEPQLLAGRPPYFVRLYWQSVKSSLDQMRDTLGASTGGSTVLRPTPLHESIRPLVDQAISQVDVFLTGTNPLVFGVPDVPRIQRDVRNLRSRLLTMRQQAIAGDSATALQLTLNQMVGDYQAAYTRWSQVVTTYRLQRPAQLSPVGDTLNTVERMINEAIASGDLTPSGPTQISGLMAALNGELGGMRTALVAFSGYPEQRSLNLFVEQCAGYTQSIADAQTTASTSIDSQRRLAAAMQRVIGLMQAEADSLNQRVLSAGTRDQQTRAANLVSQAARIGSLADEIEADLH
jgi:hypothetical protein